MDHINAKPFVHPIGGGGGGGWWGEGVVLLIIWFTEMCLRRNSLVHHYFTWVIFKNSFRPVQVFFLQIIIVQKRQVTFEKVF